MSALTFGSVCSGIEAASVAWHPLGWRAVWLAEIEAFPAAVLAHHYPDVPNLGDMTKIAAMVRARQVAAPDVLVGGTPCQAFSVAGLRKSLDDARGQLSLSFVDLANAIDSVRAVRGEPAAVVVWENVPGVLSTKDNAFGCFLAALAGEDDAVVPAGKKWSNAGCVFGPQRTVAWRITDAQFFGVAQRRRRLFVVASARTDLDPVAVLFEFEGVQRHTPPSRQAGQDAAAGTAGRTAIGSHWDGGGYAHPTLNQSNSCSGIGLSNQELFSQRGAYLVEAFGGNNQSGPIDVATACNACASASGRMDFESETFLVQPIVNTLDASYGRLMGCSGQDANHGHSHLVPVHPYAFQSRIARNVRGDMGDLVNALTAQAEETGKGDAAPCVAYAIQAGALRENPASGPDGVGVQETIAYTLEARAEVQAIAYANAGHFGGMREVAVSDPLRAKGGDTGNGGESLVMTPTVAFSCKDHGADASVEIAPTLRAMGYSGSHANGGGQLAVSIDIRNSTVERDGPTMSLQAGGIGDGRGMCINAIPHTMSAVSFKASHYTRGKDGAPSELAPPLSADADKGDQDTLILAPITSIRESGQGYWIEDDIAGTLRAEGENRPSRPSCVIFTGDGVTADPISANEAKTYTHEGSTFRLHNCIGEPFVASFAENSRGELRLEGGDGSRTGALSTGGGKPGQGIPTIAHGVLAFKPGQSEAAGGVFVTEDFAPTLQAQNNGSTPVPAVCITDAGQPAVTVFQERGRTDGRALEVGGDIAYALTAPSGGGRAQERNVQVGMAVRRLIPRECERLQAFPDDYTLITYRGKPAADGPRYKALGNSMCVNNMRWIGERIEAVLAMPAPAAVTEDRLCAGLVLCEDLAVA